MERENNNNSCACGLAYNNPRETTWHIEQRVMMTAGGTVHIATQKGVTVAAEHVKAHEIEGIQKNMSCPLFLNGEFKCDHSEQEELQ